MLLHMLHLLSRALVDFPTVISGNWLSIILPFAVFLAAEIYNYRRGGWNAVTPTLKRDVWIMTIAYACLFLWSVVRTVYSDHQDMVKSAERFKTILHQTQQSDGEILQATKNTLGGQISDLQIKCARNEGISDTLGKQNRDQQNTINNCQTQALKLLAPEPFKIVPLVLEPAGGGIEVQHVKWLLLTNKVITPIDLRLQCQKRLSTVTASIVGSAVMGGGASKVTDTVYQVKVSTPAWGPESPMIIEMSYIGDAGNPCSFIEM